MPDLSVVVWERAGDAHAAVESVLPSADHADIDAEVIVAGCPRAEGAVPTGVRRLELFPLGAAYARNRGLALASAPIVAFVDGDLVVEPSWAEAILEALEREPTADAIVGPVSGHRPGGGRPTSCGRLHLELFPPAWTLDGVSNAAFRRSTLIALHGFEHAFAELSGAGAVDAEVFIRLVRHGGRIAWAPSMSASRAPLNESVAIDRALEIGRTALRRRYPALALRYAAGPTGRGHRLQVVRDVVAGARRRPNPAVATALLELMPAGLRERLPAPLEPLARSHRAKTHFVYRAGTDYVLHLYANPSARLRRSLGERESMRARAAVGGIPRLYAVVGETDAVWVLEELIPGRPPDRRAVREWFPAVANWVVGMAGPPGRKLADVPAWIEHCGELLAFTPSELAPAVRDALEEASHLPAVHMHGDLQRQNVLVVGERVGAVDWEGAWLEGVPGLDLVFLALFAATPTPDVTILLRLIGGEDAPWGGLRDALRRVGVDGPVLRAALIAMLATWALAEDRRLARLGAEPGRRVFRALFHRFAAA